MAEKKKAKKKKKKAKSKRATQALVMEPDRDTAACITCSLTDQIARIAADCSARAIFVYSDAVPEGLPLPQNLKTRVVYVSRSPSSELDDTLDETGYLRVPNVHFTRLGQVKIAIFLALSRGVIHKGDVVVFLSGLSGSGTLDTLFVTEVGREFEILATEVEDTPLPSDIHPEVVERVLDIAAELGSEGREGKPTGALFVIGDSTRVLELSKQLILNPFRGYPESERNILDESIEETFKEMSALDGAFVVRGDGVVETCGAFLKTASQEEYELPPGLGARHHAAAAITGVSDSLAITVSESTGTVTVFRGGRVVVKIDKPFTKARSERKYPA